MRLSRQKLVGWILIVVSVAYLAYFLRVRLFTPGPILERKEWVQFIGSVVLLMVGTINVRMTGLRERARKGQPESYPRRLALARPPSSPPLPRQSTHPP